MSKLSSLEPEGGKKFSYLTCKSGRLKSALNKYSEYLCNKEMDWQDEKLISTHSCVKISWLEALRTGIAERSNVAGGEPLEQAEKGCKPGFLPSTYSFGSFRQVPLNFSSQIARVQVYCRIAGHLEEKHSVEQSTTSE